MIEIQDLQELQLDALREVASIGAGHAATALSQMTASRIMISVPRLQIARLEEIPNLISDPDAVVATVLMHVLGDVTGRTLLLLPEDSAKRLSERLLRRASGTVVEFGELEQSALKETGNILCAAYLNALSDFMGLMLLLSVPTLVIDHCGAVLTSAYIEFAQAQDYVFSIETQFNIDEGTPVAGHFLLLPDLPSLQVILKSIRLA
jgi:chemotaxis protein CheC